MPLDQLVIDYRYIYHYASTSYRRQSSHLSIRCYEAWLRVEDMNKLLDVWLNRKNIPGQHNVISLTFVLGTTYWSITPRPSTVSNVRFTFVYDLPRISIFWLVTWISNKEKTTYFLPRKVQSAEPWHPYYEKCLSTFHLMLLHIFDLT